MATDQLFINVAAAGTYGPVNLLGGYYAIDISTLTGTSPTATLTKLMADASTVAMTAALTAAGHTVVQLSPGLYELILGGTVTAAEVAVSKIKGGI